MKNYAHVFFVFLIFAGCSTIKKDINIPNSLEKSFTELDKLLADSTKQEFAKMDEDEAVGKAHFGLGLWLRNNWGLWAGKRLAVYFNDKGIFHPDDMSSIILTSYHRYLNKKDIDIGCTIWNKNFPQLFDCFYNQKNL